ncbi:MAG: hypothetical protein ACYS0K_21360 [Planctomycetota bacterium]
MRAFVCSCVLVTLLLAILPGDSQGAWEEFGNPVCTAPGWQRFPDQASNTFPAMIPTDDGGAIIAWTDRRGGDRDIYAQRLGAEGNTLWAEDGVPLCTLPEDQLDAVICSDNEGGAIIAWSDRQGGSSGRVFAQRLDPNGAPLWVVNGVPLTLPGGDQTRHEMVADGFGGAIAFWRSTSAQADVYAQRINALGNPVWDPAGVTVCSATWSQNAPRLDADGSGGAIFVWSDYRDYPGNAPDLYAQRLDASGTAQWPADGVPVCTAVGHQYYSFVSDDGAGGALIVWQDSPQRPNVFYAQRLDSEGTPLWAGDGIPIVPPTKPASDYIPHMIKDGLGGIIVVWNAQFLDWPLIYPDIVFAQRVDGQGNLPWGADALTIADGPGIQAFPVVAADGVGGAYVVWFDEIAGGSLFGQHVDAAGTFLWDPEGTSVCFCPGGQGDAQVLPHGPDRVLAVWEDGRHGDVDIYAKSVDDESESDPTGVAPSPGPDTARLSLARPNPFRSRTALEFEVDRPGPVRISVHDVGGRQLVRLRDGILQPGRHGLEWDGRDDAGRAVASGVYFIRFRDASIEETRRVVRMR